MTDAVLALIAICLFPVGALAWLGLCEIVSEAWRRRQFRRQRAEFDRLRSLRKS